MSTTNRGIMDSVVKGFEIQKLRVLRQVCFAHVIARQCVALLEGLTVDY